MKLTPMERAESYAKEYGVTVEHALLAGRDASLGVGHIWTAIQCPAYRTLDPSDCTCREGDGQ